jgi:hypothetical protein
LPSSVVRSGIVSFRDEVVGRVVESCCMYPTPGCFVEVYQKKEDAGANVRKCLKTREIEIGCFGMDVEW